MIIGISGKAGHGKNSLADMIVAALIHDFNITLNMNSFAYPLKKSAGYLFFNDEQIEELNHNFYSNEVKSLRNEKLNMTFGEFLQKFGTEVGRAIHPHFWVIKFMEEIDPDNITIVTDVRFPNEVKAIEDAGGIVLRVNRPGWIEPGRDANHPSETALDDHLFEAEFIAHDLSQLKAQFEMYFPHLEKLLYDRERS